MRSRVRSLRGLPTNSRWRTYCMPFGRGCARSTRKVDMTNIQVIQRLPASAEAVRALIGDFGGLHRWHPQVNRLDLSWEGRIRTLHYADGSRAVERLEARNDQACRYVYALVDGSLPLHGCRSRLEVQADGDECLVTWSTDFEVLGGSEAAVEADLRKLHDAGLAALASVMGDF